MSNIILLGLALYIMILVTAYYYLTIGLTFNKNYYSQIGLVLLISAIIIPPLLFAQIIELLLMNLQIILNQYPLLHVLLFGITAVIIIAVFSDAIKDIMESEISERVLTICMGLMASACGYYFFLIFISSAGGFIATLTLSITISLFVLHSSLRSVKNLKRKKFKES